uniref:Uncharacterized protein n=1 Tax=Cacopsylla melanoneura TaxID=428564 RepID=A0A8D8W863_9HEMI
MSITVNNRTKALFFNSLYRCLGSLLKSTNCLLKIISLYFLNGSSSAIVEASIIVILKNRICLNKVFRMFFENFSTTLFSLSCSCSSSFISGSGTLLFSSGTSCPLPESSTLSTGLMTASLESFSSIWDESFPT